MSIEDGDNGIILGPQTPEAQASEGTIPEMPRRRRRAGSQVQAPLEPGAGFRGSSRANLEQPIREKRGAQEAGEGGAPQSGGLRMPASVGSISSARQLWFVVSFLAPVILGALYLFLIAPDQYVTEYRFSVRPPVGTAAGNGTGTGTLSALFGGNPTPGSDLLDNYTVTDYVRSAQAARDLDAKVNLKAMFNKPFDPLSRIGGTPSAERLARYWQSMVYSDYDPASGLAVVRVKAYSAADSYAIANGLVALSGALVNSIGNQSQQDTLRFAKGQVDRANQQVATLRAQLASLRQSKDMVDPSAGVISGNTQLTNGLRQHVAEIQAQIGLLQQQLHNPAAPQIQVLRQQLAATQAQLSATTGSVGATQGGLASTVGQFEDINARLKSAVDILTAATNNLSQAQAGADSQRLYLTTYVKPSQAETSTEPNRWLDLFLIVLVAAMVWMIGMLIGNSIMEHGK